MIRLENVKKTYKKATLSYPNIEINAPYALLIGQNGSGKTTLLKAISNLIHYQGTIHRSVKCLFSEENPHFPEDMIVKEYLSIIQELTRLTSLNRFNQLLKIFELNDHLDKPFKALSKGMRQKVHLTQTLMIPKQLYLLDEPTSGLDQTALKQLVNWLKDESAQILISTHTPDIFSKLNPYEIRL